METLNYVAFAIIITPLFKEKPGWRKLWLQQLQWTVLPVEEGSSQNQVPFILIYKLYRQLSVWSRI